MNSRCPDLWKITVIFSSCHTSKLLGWTRLTLRLLIVAKVWNRASLISEIQLENSHNSNSHHFWGSTDKEAESSDLSCVEASAIAVLSCPSLDTSQNAVLLSHILDILSLCVERHTYHIRNYIIDKNILSRVLVLMTSSHGHLALGTSTLIEILVAHSEHFWLVCWGTFLWWGGL